jgi:hypothetical protein
MKRIKTGILLGMGFALGSTIVSILLQATTMAIATLLGLL